MNINKIKNIYDNNCKKIISKINNMNKIISKINIKKTNKGIKY